MKREHKHPILEGDCYRAYLIYETGQDSFILVCNIYVLQSINEFTTLN